MRLRRAEPHQALGAKVAKKRAPVPGMQRDLASRSDGADRSRMQAARVKRRKHGLDVSGRDGQQKAEARKCLEPTLERDAGRRLDGVEVELDGDAGAFGEHDRRAGNAALADVLGGAREAAFGELGSSARSARSRSGGASSAA